MLFFWPFWFSHNQPGHPNPFNWPSTHSTGPQTVMMALRLVKALIWTWHVIYFLKAMTKSLPPHPKIAHSTGPLVCLFVCLFLLFFAVCLFVCFDFCLLLLSWKSFHWRQSYSDIVKFFRLNCILFLSRFLRKCLFWVSVATFKISVLRKGLEGQPQTKPVIYLSRGSADWLANLPHTSHLWLQACGQWSAEYCTFSSSLLHELLICCTFFSWSGR